MRSSAKHIYIIAGLSLIAIISITLVLRADLKKRSRDLNEIVSLGKIHVVSENSTTGISMENDSIFGFQYEILKKFADKFKIEIEISLVNDLEKCIRNLNNGEYDLIAKYIPTTTEWQDVVAFTEPLIISRQMLVQRITNDNGKKNFLIKKQKDLAMDSIFIPYHSPHKMRIEHLSDEIADTIYIIEMKDVTSEQLVSMVSQGKIKYTICHEQLSRKMTRDYNNIDASLPISLSQPYSWAVKNNSPELQEALNKFLSEFIGSLEYWELYRTYY